MEMTLNEFLEKVRCKIILDLPLTDYERGMWVLYGDPTIKIKRG